MIKRILFLTVILSVLACDNSDLNAQQSSTDKSKDISMFPKAKEGYKQVYIEMEPNDNESNFQVELYAGIVEEVDCNNYSLMGQFTSQNLSGWGYTYYEFESNGQLRGTLMACPNGTKTEKFIPSTSIFVRYNSKLPIVIYVPNTMEVKYKIWQRQEKEYNAVESLD
jgi:ecotin